MAPADARMPRAAITAVTLASRAFEIWRDKHALPDVLHALAAQLPAPDAIAVTP